MAVSSNEFSQKSLGFSELWPCRATCKTFSWSDGLVLCNQLAPALKTWSLPDLFHVEPGDQDLISSDISHTDQFHPVSPGAPDLFLFGILSLLGGLCLQLSGRRFPVDSGQEPTSWQSRWEASLGGCHSARAAGPAPSRRHAPCRSFQRCGDQASREGEGGWSGVSLPCRKKGHGSLSPLCLQMALGLLKKEIFSWGKPPPALYQLEVKITCFGNHYLAIRASTHWKHSSVQNMPWKENTKPHLSENIGSEQRGDRIVREKGRGESWHPSPRHARPRRVMTGLLGISIGSPSSTLAQSREGQGPSMLGSCVSAVCSPFTGPQSSSSAGCKQRFHRAMELCWDHIIPVGII